MSSLINYFSARGRFDPIKSQSEKLTTVWSKSLKG